MLPAARADGLCDALFFIQNLFYGPAEERAADSGKPGHQGAGYAGRLAW